MGTATRKFDPTKPLTLAAEVEIGAAGAGDSGRRFSGVAYAGGRIPSYNMVVNLALTEIVPNMPVLLQHEHKDTIGVVDQVTKNGTLSVAGSIFSDIDENAAQIVAKSQRGLRYQMSMGIFHGKLREIEAGGKETINGQEFHGPLYVLENGKVREVSVVALGADGDTMANFFSAAALPTEDKTAMNELEQAQAQVTQLTADLAAEKTAREAAETELKTTRAAARETALKALFSDIGREYKAEAVGHYLTMSDEAFAATAADLRAMAKKPNDSHLFTEQTGTGAALNLAQGKESALKRDARARGWTK